MKQYVLGFCFDERRENVVLIKKLRPAFQAGKLNGIGGKVEGEETITTAMIREFYEETGVATDYISWDYFSQFDCLGSEDGTGERSQIFCFKLFDTDTLMKVRTVEEEIVAVYNIKNLATGYHDDPLMENVLMLIYIAINKNNYSNVAEFTR